MTNSAHAKGRKTKNYKVVYPREAKECTPPNRHICTERKGTGEKEKRKGGEKKERKIKGRKGRRRNGKFLGLSISQVSALFFLLYICFVCRNLQPIIIVRSSDKGFVRVTLNSSLGFGVTHNSTFHVAPDSTRFSTHAPNRTKDFGGVWSRPYNTWPSDRPLPCFETENPKIMTDEGLQKMNPTKEGLVYLKLMKVAGSTHAGVHVRIARNLARRQGWKKGSICRSRYVHAQGNKYKDRSKTQSFLWSTVREPTRRYISQFFHFHVSRRNVEPSIINFKEYLKKDRFLNNEQIMNRHSIQWLSTDINRTDPIIAANNIIKDYDFISITERADESLVVLTMLLNIPLGDVLHLDSKRSGGYDDGGFQQKCFFIQPANLSPEIEEFLSSKLWRKYIKPEELLYRAANHSLDLTIDRLGQAKVADRLTQFRHAQQVAQKRCGPITKFPCSSEGERRSTTNTDCFMHDFGCGLDCLDQIAEELGISNKTY